jgi:Holliday junction resolvase RusA-like endonuclease
MVNMMTIVIPLEPVPWAAHRGYGKKSFNPKYKEREAFQYYIRQQYKDKPIEGAVIIYFQFQMPIPKSFAKKKKLMASNRELAHTKKPDCTNMQKFTEDCLKGILFIDDSQVVGISSSKFYSEIPQVMIQYYATS